MTPIVAFAGLILASIATASPPGSDSLPDRLADSTFWRIVTTFSERDGTFISENFISNEDELQTVIPSLLKDVRPNGAYIGVGPDQNFTYISAFKPGIAFICDIRRQNLLQHLMYKALFEISDDRADFLANLFSRPRPAGLDSASSPIALISALGAVPPDTLMFATGVRRLWFNLVHVHGFSLTSADSAGIRKVLGAFVASGPSVHYGSNAEGGRAPFAGDAPVPPYPSFASTMTATDAHGTNHGWLASEQAYRRIREYQSRNLIVPVVGDFAGSKALAAIAAFLREQDVVLRWFYASNVEQYLYADSLQGDFYRNVARFTIDSASVFIRSFSNSYVKPALMRSRLVQATSSIGATLEGHAAGTLKMYASLARLSGVR